MKKGQQIMQHWSPRGLKEARRQLLEAGVLWVWQDDEAFGKKKMEEFCRADELFDLSFSHYIESENWIKVKLLEGPEVEAPATTPVTDGNEIGNEEGK